MSKIGKMPPRVTYNPKTGTGSIIIDQGTLRQINASIRSGENGTIIIENAAGKIAQLTSDVAELGGIRHMHCCTATGNTLAARIAKSIPVEEWKAIFVRIGEIAKRQKPFRVITTRIFNIKI